MQVGGKWWCVVVPAHHFVRVYEAKSSQDVQMVVIGWEVCSKCHNVLPRGLKSQLHFRNYTGVSFGTI
jgi:hypothetical protein